MSSFAVPDPKAPRRRRFHWGSIRERLRVWLQRLVVGSAVAYPVCLIALVIGLGYVGEEWWLTTIGLYVPHLLFALPLPFLAAALWAYRQFRLLAAQLVSVVTLHFLVGFVVPFPTGDRDGEPRLRVLSFNVDNGYVGYEAITKQIVELSPDVVLLQEAAADAQRFAEMLRAHYAYVEQSTQFAIASRFPILSTTDPSRIPFMGNQRSPRFLRHLLRTPLGEMAFYNVHPISPRGVMNLHRFRYALHMLRTGALFSGDPESGVRANAGLRQLQVQAVASLALGERHPVVIGGDFNLPGPSPAFRRALSGYQDGFRAAGWGLGYTFPSKYPWLRLDRVLASDSLRFTGFEVGCKGLSDHRCIVADIQRR